MTKIIGSLLIISATSLWGVRMANGFKDEYRQIQYIQKILWQIKSRIGYTRADLGEVFLQVARELREPYKSWLMDISLELERNDGRLASTL